MLSQATRRTKASEPLTCEIILNHDFTLADNAKLTIEFIKFLCVQKGQIPVPCSQLEKLASLAKVEIEKTPNNFKTSKERNTSLKSKRKQTQFVKKAENFQDNFKELCRSINSSFEYQSQQVAVILGTSLFNPREIFVLDWSSYPVTNQLGKSTIVDEKDFLKKQASFFRYLVTSDNLFPLLQTIRPTKLHVLCQTDSIAPVGCIPRLNYKLTPLSRGRQVTIRIVRQLQIPLNAPALHNRKDFEKEPDAFSPCRETDALSTTRAVSRKLVFSSPAATVLTTQHYREKDCSLDLSGFDRLMEDDTALAETALAERCNCLCWFQIQSSLTGFIDTFKQDS